MKTMIDVGEPKKKKAERAEIMQERPLVPVAPASAVPTLHPAVASRFDNGRKTVKKIAEFIVVVFMGDDGITNSSVWVWYQPTIFDHSKHWQILECPDFFTARERYDNLNTREGVVKALWSVNSVVWEMP